MLNMFLTLFLSASLEMIIAGRNPESFSASVVSRYQTLTQGMLRKGTLYRSGIDDRVN